MKDPRVAYGQPVRWRGGCWFIAAQVIAPEETVLVRRGTEGCGERIPPAEWAQAAFDSRDRCWVVPEVTQ